MHRRLVALILALAPTALASPAIAQTISFSNFESEIGVGLQTGVLQARLSDSQHGGIFITISVDDPLLGLVAPDASTVGSASIDVFVPNGSTDASFVAQGLEAVTGTIQITASAPGFTPVTQPTTLVTPIYDLTSVPTTLDVPDPASNVRVRVGLPFLSSISLRSMRFGGPGAVATISVDDPLVAEMITSTTSGASVSVDIPSGSFQSATTVATGGAAINGVSAGTVVVTASVPDMTPHSNATRTMTVNAAEISLEDLPADVGAGLVSSQMQARLNGPEHGGVTIRIESNDPSKVLVAAAASDVGSNFVDVFVANGGTGANFYLHGLEAQSGIATITTSAIGFGSDTQAVTVVPGAFRITGLLGSLDTLDPDDAFYVDVGLPNFNGTNLSSLLALRPGGPGVTVTFTSLDSTVGVLTTLAGTAGTRNVDIVPGEFRTPTTVANGGVAHDGIAPGTTTIVTSIPGFVPTSASTASVTVSAPGMSIQMDDRVGAGLSSTRGRAILDASAHGGVDVHVEVLDPSRALVSPDTGVTGTSAIDVPVADGSTSAFFYVHGLEGQSGTVHLSITAPGFGSALDSVEIAPPYMRLTGLGTTIETFDSDDAFYVQLGVLNGSTFSIRTLRSGVPNLPVTLNVDDLAVGRFVTTTQEGNDLTVEAAPDASSTPTTIGQGGIAFDGLSPGTAVVTASAPGFTLSPGPQTVTVTETGMSFSPDAKVGAGLQTSTRTIQLGGPQHPGVTVRVESLDPALALVASNAATPGAGFFEAFVDSGSTSLSYVVSGVDGQAGTATLQVSAPGFVTQTRTTEVVQPGVQFVFLAANLDVSDPDDPFTVRVGLPNSGASSINVFQGRRAGQPPLVATVTSSDPSVVELVTLAGVGAAVTTEIDPGTFSSPNSVANGGVAGRAVGAGTSLVTSTIPGFVTVGNGNLLVTVTNSGIALPGVPAAIGSGLQVGPLNAVLSDAFHGGVTLQLASQDPAKLLVSTDPGVVGSSSVSIPLTNGDATATYYLQALEGVTGTVGITATASGFNAGAASIAVQPAAIQIVQLPDSLNVNVPDELFAVEIGVAEQDDSALAQLQVVRPGGTLPPITLSVSDSTLAILETSGASGSTVDVTIAVGATQTGSSVGSGGVVLDPQLPGTVTVSATAPGLTSTTAATRAVTFTGTVVGVPLPRTLSLSQNRPNPFNPATVIAFELPAHAKVSLHVYDLAGRRVATLVEGRMEAGRHELVWRGRDGAGHRVASGTYFYVLDTGKSQLRKKMTLLK